MLRTRSIMVVVALAALVAAGCGGDGDDDAGDGDGDTITLADESDDTTDDDGSGAGADGASGNSADGASGGSGDLQAVWTLPPGDYQVWLPYQLIDDEFQYSESASFQTMSASMDDVLAFYRDYFPTIGLIPNELELGESIAMNLTNPNDPLWSGVVQTGVDPEGYVTINQNYTDPKEQTSTTAADTGGAVSSDGAGAASEDG